MTSCRLIAIIDPSNGASGDMLLGALVSALGEDAWLRALPGRLGLSGVSVDIRPVARGGIEATKVTVRLGDGSYEGAGTVTEGSELPAPPAGHGHHHVIELIEQIASAGLATETADAATRALQLLADAEGQVHGVAPEDVVLHEVGAADALVDIVGVIEGFRRLGVEAIYHWPPSLGAGFVRTAHGVLPVPAPATAVLLQGMDVRQGGPATGEALTPTGAVLLRVLSRGTPPEFVRITSASAWGAGERDPEGYPNALRLILGEVDGAPGREREAIVVLATDVDDMPGEYLHFMRGALESAGALDVQLWATQAKRGRISFRIEVLATPERADALESVLLADTTTLGVRRWTTERRALPRRRMTVTAEDGSTVSVKLSGSGKYLKAKPEVIDMERVAAASGKPLVQVARELQLQLWNLVQDRLDDHERSRAEEKQ